jgi:F-type H+-transporting ATPase subunit alpha
VPLHVSLQVVSIYAGTRGHLDELEIAEIRPFEAKLHAWLKDNRADLLELIARAKSKPDLAKVDTDLETSISAFKELYLKDPARKQVKG